MCRRGFTPGISIGTEGLFGRSFLNVTLCKAKSDNEVEGIAEDSTSSYSEHIHLASDGTNTGAAMFVRQRPPGAPAKDCCYINIYVNNNIQGVTNSMLFGSRVIMRDPGARLSFSFGQKEGSPFGRRKDGSVVSSFLWGFFVSSAVCISLLVKYVFGG